MPDDDEIPVLLISMSYTWEVTGSYREDYRKFSNKLKSCFENHIKVTKLVADLKLT